MGRDVVAILAAFVIWLVLIVKALQGEPFQLPLLGDFAEQQSGEQEKILSPLLGAKRRREQRRG